MPGNFSNHANAQPGEPFLQALEHETAREKTRLGPSPNGFRARRRSEISYPGRCPSAAVSRKKHEWLLARFDCAEPWRLSLPSSNRVGKCPTRKSSPGAKRSAARQCFRQIRNECLLLALKLLEYSLQSKPTSSAQRDRKSSVTPEPTRSSSKVRKQCRRLLFP